MDIDKIREKAAQKAGDELVRWFQYDLHRLMEPEQIPEGSTEEIKAYKMHLFWLKDKIALIKRLQKPKSDAKEIESYE